MVLTIGFLPTELLCVLIGKLSGPELVLTLQSPCMQDINFNQKATSQKVLTVSYLTIININSLHRQLQTSGSDS